MISSMTGFGRSSVESNGYEFTVEVKSLNNRYLDVSIRLSRNMAFLEEELRKIAVSNLNRGKIEINMICSNSANQNMLVEVNQPLAASYVDCLHKLAEQFDLEKQISLTSFLSIPEIIITKRKEDDNPIIIEAASQALVQALDHLKKMKDFEGEKLKTDSLYRIKSIKGHLEIIESRSVQLVDDYRCKLKSRLKELLNNTDLDEIRLNMEIAFLAEKTNITEELVRIKSHLNHFETIIENGGPVGRKLDFLLQEINREVNTLSSKISDLVVINAVIEMKSELEKIREQIQNIE